MSVQRLTHPALFQISEISEAKFVKQHLGNVFQEQTSKTFNYLKAMVSHSNQIYPAQFVQKFCLIKIYSLMKPQCPINDQFLQEFIKIFNRKLPWKIHVSANDQQLFSEILLVTDLYRYSNLDLISNVLTGQCLLATTICFMLKQTQTFMKKAQTSFALCFLALRGKPEAFLSKVHTEKNHPGSIGFADRISKLIKIKSSGQFLKKPKEDRKVQDSYSIRCAPQVYGVVYQCLSNAHQEVEQIINKSHFKFLKINGRLTPNLNLFSDKGVLCADFLIESLNEIGSMAFLRAQRILNVYLGKNSLHSDNADQVHWLSCYMESVHHHVAENKIISTPSNIDTMNIRNYEKDVFYTSSKSYSKFHQMMNNLHKILLLEIESSLLAIDNVYHVNKGELFESQQLKHEYLNLTTNLNIKNYENSIKYISNH